MQKLTDYEKRQIALINEKINAYKEQKINLRTLIDDLGILGGYVESVNEKWKKKFSSIWWDLEEVYAGALADNSKEFDIEDKKVINNAIAELEKLLEEINK